MKINKTVAIVGGVVFFQAAFVLAAQPASAPPEEESIWGKTKNIFSQSGGEKSAEDSTSSKETDQEKKDSSAKSSGKTAEEGKGGGWLSNFSSPFGGSADSSSEHKGGDSKKTTGNKLKIQDITDVPTMASVQLDPACKQIVAPFGTTDSAISLGIFAMKIKAAEAIGGQGRGFQAETLIKQAAVTLNWLPMSAEMTLGDSLLESKKSLVLEEGKNSNSKKRYIKARKILQDVLSQLPEETPYEFRIFVMKDSKGNAQALPGGIILVDSNLVDERANESLAFFKVAHEVSHVLQRHQTRMYQARLVDGIDTFQKFSSFIADAKSGSQFNIGYLGAVKNLFIGFSESQELQADSCAFNLMSRKYQDGDSLSGSIRFIESRLGPVVAVDEKSTDRVSLLDLTKNLTDGQFEKHPNTSRRKQNLEDLLGKARTNQISMK